MGKKNLNPADAHRKALKKKEKDKNKESRTKAREVKTLKTDTGEAKRVSNARHAELSAEIRKLEEAGRRNELDKSGQARLSELRSELDRVKKVKSDYVEKHPEHRGLVYRERKNEDDGGEGASTSTSTNNRSLFRKNGLPKHPERSIYYDPVLNPYGMPPPGMPYMERPLLPHELAAETVTAGATEEASGSSDDSSDEDDDDDSDVPLPDGAKGKDDGGDESSDDDDSSLRDIPLPPGPPPSKAKPRAAPPLPPGPPPPIGFTPTFDSYGGMIPPPPPLGFGVPGHPSIPPPPPPPPGFAVSAYPAGVPPPPPPPPGFAMAQVVPPTPFEYLPNYPIPPPFPTQVPPLPPVVSQPAQRPKGLPSKPSLPPPPPSLPSKPGAPPSGAVISAEPELRDFKKESTAFVPAALKRKQAEKEKDGIGKKARLENDS
ncbi:hypothetical protein M407DRAFT_217829 [Tulasnella calospora MUT 4182]|uniref:Wbp11/ELF5/Saf1 N-terminal domain-containing protein n=1 Tax=Tulasnella calospora MUT 4182 TaxID=1051891 RepID=A0A0C3QIB1_9AGAM|nr:hypothetical protein M407DRAFT_217829 [Tulasnella calospora MUT 4182]